MLYTISGKLTAKGADAFVLEWNGMGLRFMTHGRAATKLPPAGTALSVYCFLYVREEQPELYGFLDEQSLKLFELLNGVSGIGPRTALAILDVDSVENLMAAIIERRADLLTKASGIGRKTAERAILELSNKIKLPHPGATVLAMDVDRDVEDVLVGLGYRRERVREVLRNLGKEGRTAEERLRLALRGLSRPLP